MVKLFLLENRAKNEVGSCQLLSYSYMKGSEEHIAILSVLSRYFNVGKPNLVGRGDVNLFGLGAGLTRARDWLKYLCVNLSTGTYSAGLRRLITDNGVTVFVFNRQGRVARRWGNKSGLIDSGNTVRSILFGLSTPTPKQDEAPARQWVCFSRRRSAVKART